MWSSQTACQMSIAVRLREWHTIHFLIFNTKIKENNCKVNKIRWEFLRVQYGIWKVVRKCDLSKKMSVIHTKKQWYMTATQCRNRILIRPTQCWSQNQFVAFTPSPKSFFLTLEPKIVPILLAKHQLFQELTNEILHSIAQPITETIKGRLNGIRPTQNARHAVR